MGQRPIDQYTLLHFAAGIVAYFWGVSAWVTFVAHVVFEVVENTKMGVHFINTYLTLWPGGKPYPDTVINSIFDTAATMVGWYVARAADAASTERHLYP